MRWNGVICFVLALTAFTSPLFAAVTVKEIRITGNEKVSSEKIRRVLGLKEGGEYREERVREALKQLFATKQFADLRLYKTEVEGGVILEVEVEEYPQVDEVRYRGNKHLKEEEIDKEISITPGSFLSPAVLARAEETLKEMYKDKGYYRASLSDTVTVEKGKRILTINIDEGEKVSIKHIDFFGNVSLDSDHLRKVMKSKEDRWWRGAEFKPKQLEEDEERIVSLYREHGFLDAAVKKKELIFTPDGKGLDVFFTIEEGRQYRVGKVSWHGNKVVSDEEIVPLVVLHEGDVFNDKVFRDMQFNISSLYWDRGYIYSTVDPIKRIRGSTVDVDLEISEGNRARVHEINIAGNTKTAERVIRRQLVVAPGDVFLRPRLLRSLREVFNLGFFAGPPEVETKPANEEGDIDITIKVKEKQTGQFRMGAGFSALNSLSGFLGISETNFLGRGQQLSINWEFSRYIQNIDLRFTEPWLMGTPTELSVSLYNTIQNQVRQQFYDDRRRGFSLRVGRPFPWFDYTSIYWRYRFEEVELSNFAPSYGGPLLRIKWPQRTSSTSLTLSRNSTDSPFHPTTGTAAYVTAEFNGGKVLGGDAAFQRYEAQLAWYGRLFWKLVLEIKFQVGVLDGYSSPSQVPDYELFRLGGNRRYGVRGYDYFEITPEGNPEYIGGRYMQIFSYEASFPLTPTVYGVFFLDGGNTWNSFREADPFDLKKGAGLGIRLELPMLGTVGMDYGYGFDKRGGPAWEPHISLGGYF